MSSNRHDCGVRKNRGKIHGFGTLNNHTVSIFKILRHQPTIRFILYKSFRKGHFPLGGIFRTERHFLLFKRPIGGEWASKDKRKYSAPKISPSGKQPLRIQPELTVESSSAIFTIYFM